MIQKHAEGEESGCRMTLQVLPCKHLTRIGFWGPKNWPLQELHVFWAEHVPQALLTGKSRQEKICSLTESCYIQIHFHKTVFSELTWHECPSQWKAKSLDDLGKTYGQFCEKFLVCFLVYCFLSPSAGHHPSTLMLYIYIEESMCVCVVFQLLAWQSFFWHWKSNLDSEGFRG